LYSTLQVRRIIRQLPFRDAVAAVSVTAHIGWPTSPSLQEDNGLIITSTLHILLCHVCYCCYAQADGTVAEGFDGVGEIIPPGLFDNGRPGRGEMALGWEELSGKLALVARLLAVLRQTCDDK
jgi:hypothetical protein